MTVSVPRATVTKTKVFVPLLRPLGLFATVGPWISFPPC